MTPAPLHGNLSLSRALRALLVVGAVLLMVGIVAGVGNREVLDGSRFATHVDHIRSDEAVSRQVGIVISDRLTSAAPDLVVAKPLIESTTGVLVGSAAFGPVVRAMVTPVHTAFTTDGSDHIVLRLADVGAVLVAALAAVAPDVADSLPPGLDITLVSFGDQAFASTTIEYAHLLKLLAWLLPLLAVICFGAVIVLASNRERAIRAIGLTVATVGLALGAMVFVASVVASFVSTDSLRSALAVASWNELRGPLWIATAVVVAAGYLVVLATALRLGGSPKSMLINAYGWLIRPPASNRERLGRAALLIAVGVAGVLKPLTVATVVIIALAFVVTLHGATELVTATRRTRGGVGAVPRIILRPEVRTALVVGASLAIVAGLVAWNARPPQAAVAAIGVSSGKLCNGYAQLCDRRFNQVSYPATHNSMSAADEDGWFLAEQPTGIIGQLDDGIRALLIDSWQGQGTQREGVVANAGDSRGAAIDEAVAEYGKDVLPAALRLRKATSLEPVGPVEPYLCHAICELGATRMEPALAEIRRWMETHPREVVTLFIQDEVSPDDTATVFQRSGLLSLVYTATPGKPWPTLRTMIDTNQRLVVLSENTGGGDKYPWLLQGFDWIQDTPYDAMKASDFSCELLRGSAEGSLLLVNHWLNRPQHRVSDSAKVNAAEVLGPRLEDCISERRHIPNFVAVDYYDHGALFSEVNRLNGVR